MRHAVPAGGERPAGGAVGGRATSCGGTGRGIAAASVSRPRACCAPSSAAAPPRSAATSNSATSCGRRDPSTHSCRNRHCPKCKSLAPGRVAGRAAGALAPDPVLPPGLHAAARAERAHPRPTPGAATRSSSEAVAATLKTFARDPRHLGAEIGVTAVLHTWSPDPRRSHPPPLHRHRRRPRADGTGWRRSKGRGYLFPVAAMAALFRGKFLARLVAAHRQGALVAPGRAPRSPIPSRGSSS